MTRILLADQDDLTQFGRDRGTGTVLPDTDLRRGDVYMHSGLGCLMVYNGNGWRQVHLSGADPTATATSYSGALHFGFQTRYNGILHEWDGTAWRVVDGGGHARYLFTAGAVQNLAGSAIANVVLGTAEDAHADVTQSADKTTFTLNRAGVWHIEGAVSFVTGPGAGNRYGVFLGDGTFNTFFAGNSFTTGGVNSADLPVSITKRFAAGQNISLAAFCTAATSIVNAGDPVKRTNLSLTYLRP